MCGIVGIIAPGSKSYQDRLERMIESLRHRGPDDRGAGYFPHCALGHTRLSIVDLKTGRQPMFSPDRQTALVFNGEIYGYQHIRSELEDYPFQTSSDTEVILALYSRYQENLISRLPGMFAFALWDESRQSLFCARDRFGEKPLFYAFGEKGEFVFASEIKAILASGLVRPILDQDSFLHYLRHLYVHPTRTIYNNIHSLPPAHHLIFRDGRLRLERYWRIPPAREKIEIPEAVENLKTLFERAVQNQLVADVPVGAFLSGGLDSSTLTAVASRHRPGLRTFSFGFGENLSELPFAREVASLYRTEHLELADREADLADLLLEMPRVYDEPFADSSCIPTYLICKLAREHGKSVLSGDGGDELLAGYDFWYRSLLPLENQPPSPSWKNLAAKIILRTISLLPGLPERFPATRAREILARAGGVSIAFAHHRQNLHFTDADLRRLGLDAPREEFVCPQTWLPTGTLNDAMFMDVEDYLPGDILVKTDRASMANSLELRAPFLDIDLASFCLSLPSRLKITPREDKLILRLAFSGLWPESVRRRGKQGFGAPVDKWLKLASVGALKNRYLNSPDRKIFSLISFPQSREFVARDNSRTWILLVLSLWMEKHEFRFC